MLGSTPKGPRRRQLAPSRITSQQRVIALACLVAIGCMPVRLVSDYDETTDREVSSLQRFVDDSLAAIAKQRVPACLYAGHAQFYSAVHSALHALLIRNRARGRNNGPTTAQIGVLDTMEMRPLEQLHRLAANRSPAACMDSTDFALDRQAIDQTFEAILKLELAKKRGA